MLFKREFVDKLPESTFFLFGPRMTGKTTILRDIDASDYYDLLDPELELSLRSSPGIFWQQISALDDKSTVIVDEIQRIPELLNYVQMGIDRKSHRFILSGSSARKLKRGGANLLGGRALNLKLHPLTVYEVEDNVSIDTILSYGSLPKVASLCVEKNFDSIRQYLKSYIQLYIKQEIQAEALTRNLGAFQRFLNIAAQSSGQVIAFQNISRECSVPASTVKEYFQILEDTLIGFLLWPFDRSERKKAHPKFYLFDCGVLRAIQNRLSDPPTPDEKGVLFETWLINELLRIRDYMNKDHEISFWRNYSHEIDAVISGGHGPILGIECKSGNADISKATVGAFQKAFPDVRLIVASLKDERPRISHGVEMMPWTKVIELYRELH
jgi:predicted AAA+ superfamily ATPase